MAYLEELNERVERWWAEALTAQPDFLGVPQRGLSSNVAELDAMSFLNGLDSEPPLYWIEDGYKLFSKLLPKKKDGSFKQWNIFERSSNYVRDETIAHYGALWELNVAHGWSVDAIFSEPEADGVLNRGSINALVKTPGGEAWLVVEAKGDTKKLKRLISEMNKCDGESGLGHPPTEHRKCEAIQYFQPRLFWGVACGPIRNLYRVVYQDRSVRFLPETDDALLAGRGAGRS